jgi:hypothetical protein
MKHIDINNACLKKYDPFVVKKLDTNKCYVSIPFRYIEMYFVDFFDQHKIGWIEDETPKSEDSVLVPIQPHEDTTIDTSFNGEKVEWFMINKDGETTNITNRTLYYYQISQFNIEWWYDYLPEHVTPKTWLVPLTTKEIQAILSSAIGTNKSDLGEYRKI